MPTIRMLKTEKGSPDGINIQVYERGREYDLPKSLSDVFLKIGSAELHTEHSSTLVHLNFEKKAEIEAPNNKAEMTIPSNKTEEVVVPKRKSFKRK